MRTARTHSFKQTLKPTLVRIRIFRVPLHADYRSGHVFNGFDRPVVGCRRDRKIGTEERDRLVVCAVNHGAQSAIQGYGIGRGA